MGTTRDEDVADYNRLISRAEAAVEALRDTYRQQLADDVTALNGIWSRLESGEPAAAILDELYGIAHNIKGQGGSFGYDLVSEIGASFCNYLRSGSRGSPEYRPYSYPHAEDGLGERYFRRWRRDGVADRREASRVDGKRRRVNGSLYPV